MRIIDFENHFYTRDFLDSIKDRTEIPVYESQTDIMKHGGDGVVGIRPILDKLLDMAEGRIAEMDAAGVDVQIMSASLGVEQLPEDEGCAEAVKLNNALHEAVKAHPDRLKGYAVLNLKNPARAEEELKRCGKELEFVGWNAYSNYEERSLDDDEVFPLLKTAAELGMYIYIHPTVPRGDRYHGYGPALATSGLGFSHDVNTALTRLILNGTFDALPDLKVVIGQIFMLIACSTVFGQALNISGLPQLLVNAFSNFGQVQFLLMLNILLLIMGCFFDSGAAVLILAPLLLPASNALGINPVHLGIVFTVNLSIGMFTPPFGMNIFVAQSVLGQPMSKIAKSLVPFIIIYIFALLFITYIPSISLALLN